MSIPVDEKIRPLHELATRLARSRAEKKTVVLTHGIFEVLHLAAIRHLERARKEGDLLVVTVAPDGPLLPGEDRPLFDQNQRAEALASLQCVDHVAIARGPQAADPIRTLQPDIYMPWEDEAIPREERVKAREAAAAVVRAVGGRTPV